jgi:hypothetical protein
VFSLKLVNIIRIKHRNQSIIVVTAIMVFVVVVIPISFKVVIPIIMQQQYLDYFQFAKVMYLQRILKMLEEICF